MKRLLAAALFATLVIVGDVPAREGSDAPPHAAIDKSDACKLHGKVKFVTSFPDYKIQIVTSFPDIKVQKVTSFPDKPGEWMVVDSFPDFTVQVVDSFPDFKVEYVDSFPGCP